MESLSTKEQYVDIDKYTRVYFGKDADGPYRYFETTNEFGLCMGNKYMDTIKELAEKTGLCENEVTETLIAEALEPLL